MENCSSRPSPTFPLRIVESARRIDRELVETLGAMIRDREAITAAAVVRRMPSITQISTLTRDPWRAAQLAERKAKQDRLEHPVAQVTLDSGLGDLALEFPGLTYFLTLARTGNFGRASRELKIEQAALSHHIRNLESGLDVALFVRHSRGVTLTQAGLRLLSQTSAIGSVPWQSSEHSQRTKQLSIGVPSELGPLVIPEAIVGFRREHPEAAVTIVEGSSASLEEMIVSGQVDIAILHDPGRFDTIKLDPVFVQDLGLIGSSATQLGQKISLAELTRLRLILPSRRYSVRRKIDDIAFRHGLHFQIILEVDSVNLIKSLVQRDIGFTVLPLLAVKEEAECGFVDFRPIEHPSLVMTYAIAATRASKGGLAEAFSYTLRNIIRSQVAAGRWHGTRLINQES